MEMTDGGSTRLHLEVHWLHTHHGGFLLEQHTCHSGLLLESRFDIESKSVYLSVRFVIAYQN